MFPRGLSMKDMNNAYLHGRVVREPELKTTQNGKLLLVFTLAVNGLAKTADDSNASFFEVEAWEGTAERCAHYLKKGQGITVIGSVLQRRWTTKEGKRASKVSINARLISLDVPYAEANTTAQETSE